VLRLAKALLIAVLLISISAPWAILQSAAWLGMAVAYSVEEGSVGEGLSMTFDGEHPCPLCKFVKAETSKEGNSKQESSVNQPSLKQHLFVQTNDLILTPPAGRKIPAAENQIPLRRANVPSLPPPRISVA
jgi:hypothetical protein